MANKPISSTQQTVLQRGKACLGCRRRKMRCDGARPSCTQCIRGNRAGDCEYTDRQGPTHTQVLEENVALLQARIRELEAPDFSNRPILLHDPYKTYRQAGSSTTLGASSRSMPSRPGQMSWWEFEEPPTQISDMLVAAFLPHASSLGFVLSATRFRAGLSLPALHPGRPHPALLHVVYLWSLRLTNSPDLMQHENLYLQRAILALQDALSSGGGNLDGPAIAQRRIHAMQAEILLAQYFFSLGRLLEGRYHANAAVTLSVSCGLHRISRSPGPALSRISFGSSANLGIGLFELAAPRDALELGERVRVFWMIYITDRCWSVALGAPCVLADDGVLGTQINTPWPREVDEYERINDIPSAVETGSRTVHNFLSGQSVQHQEGGGNSYLALRAKASALYERAARLAAMWYSGKYVSTETVKTYSLFACTDLQALARTTTNFARSLTPLAQLATQVVDFSADPDADSRQTLLVVHGLAHAAMIPILAVRGASEPSGDMSVINARLTHASEIARVLDMLSGDMSSADTGTSAGMLDPILSIIGLSAAQVFLEEYNRMRQSPQAPTSTSRMEALRAHIERIKIALGRGTGPIFAQQVTKIDEMFSSE
ncbi:hypothetical protein DFH11DRAFT_1863409 [Phellopilus nigrolimitatus]|nr:hypothetical protein DFH11DRAFT_1863409 [Phellopilus nigrolimitatus]